MGKSDGHGQRTSMMSSSAGIHISVHGDPARCTAPEAVMSGTTERSRSCSRAPSAKNESLGLPRVEA
jgi:hypothetical protein